MNDFNNISMRVMEFRPKRVSFFLVCYSLLFDKTYYKEVLCSTRNESRFHEAIKEALMEPLFWNYTSIQDNNLSQWKDIDSMSGERLFSNYEWHKTSNHAFIPSANVKMLPEKQSEEYFTSKNFTDKLLSQVKEKEIMVQNDFSFTNREEIEYILHK